MFATDTARGEPDHEDQEKFRRKHYPQYQAYFDSSSMRRRIEFRADPMCVESSYYWWCFATTKTRKNANNRQNGVGRDKNK